ncbi:hypothetical protein TNCV_3672151 [Trichonephila clavipes]|nr:hypothetical protein TNCV_3672151 [Trichonephila clavipes]
MTSQLQLRLDPHRNLHDQRDLYLDQYEEGVSLQDATQSWVTELEKSRLIFKILSDAGASVEEMAWNIAVESDNMTALEKLSDWHWSWDRTI